MLMCVGLLVQFGGSLRTSCLRHTFRESAQAANIKATLEQRAAAEALQRKRSLEPPKTPRHSDAPPRTAQQV